MSRRPDHRMRQDREHAVGMGIHRAVERVREGSMPGSDNSMKTLTVLETTKQAEWFMEQPQHDPPLVVTPEAAQTCRDSGTAYTRIEDYVPLNKRFTEYASNLDDYLDWEQWLDQWSRSAMPEYDRAGFNPASCTSFLLQFLFGEVWSAATTVNDILDIVKPERTRCWSPRVPGVPWHLHPTVSAIPAVLPSLARARGVAFDDLSEVQPKCTPESDASVHGRESRAGSVSTWSRQLKQKLREFPAVNDLLFPGGDHKLESRGRSRRDRPHILVSGSDYGLMEAARELRHHGARVTIIADSLLEKAEQIPDSPNLDAYRRAVRDNSEQLLQTPRFWEPLEALGIGHIDLWSAPFLFWWEQLVPILWSAFNDATGRLRTGRYTALLTWDVSGSSTSSAAVAAATNLGIPCYVLQHGSSSGVSPLIWQSYLRFCDHFLVYGDGTRKELSAASNVPRRCEITPVGSILLDAFRNAPAAADTNRLRTNLQGDDHRPIVLYVPTCFGCYGRSFHDLAAYPDVSYFELQMEVLALWNTVTSTRLVYKDFILANYPNEVMATFIRRHVKDAVVTTQRLKDLIWAADAIVIDHAITAIGEVLMTDKPIVCYMPQPSASAPEAAALLRKRANVAETPAVFMSMVRDLLARKSYAGITRPNTEFLRHYCTHDNNGRSAERAASVILAQPSHQ